MSILEDALRRELTSELRFDRSSRSIYSVDASIYEVLPQGIVIPKSEQELLSAMRIAFRHGASVTPRGAATGIAGGAIGPGLILDTAKHLTRILSVDYEKEIAVCQPGVVQDQLNQLLLPHGYRFGPDTSTGNRATLGGMLGNNSSGAHSPRYGRTVDHVLECRLILDDGTLLHLRPLDQTALDAICAQNDREGALYRRILSIRETYRDHIAAQFPTHARRASGYNLDTLISEGPLNLTPLVVGAEGSLGVVSEMTVRIVRRPKHIGMCVLQLDALLPGLSLAPELKQLDPCAFELMDHHVINMGRQSPSMRGRLDWLQGDPKAIFVVEFDAEDHDVLIERLHQCEELARDLKLGYSAQLFTETRDIDNVWALRKSGLGLLQARRSTRRGVAFVEDMSVPTESLAQVIGDFTQELAKHGLEVGIYGHVGPGCIHMRPFVDMTQARDLEVMQELMEKLLDLVVAHKGVLSGEHGDGYLRSWQNERLFGPELYACFTEIKQAFDPDERMNPGKVIPTQAFRQNLRMDDTVRQVEIPTKYSWESEGGFALSVDMCNGNGACRKREGLMCPSYHASGDEYDTTRARAQVLRSIINGRVPVAEWTDRGLYDVLDLCIECKGCKKECPSQVDMAKMKSEFLYHFQKEHGVPLRSRLFGQLPLLNRLGCATAPFSNWLASSRLSRWAGSKLGIAPQRQLPPFAHQRFSKWVAAQPQGSGQPVVLFNDTYSEFNHPEVGRSAFEILKALGYQILVPPYRCCGRPLLSKGLLDQAEKGARHLVAALKGYVDRKLPIVGLEPSCILTLRDEFPSLVNGDDAAELARYAFTLDEFLAEHVENGTLALALNTHQERQIHLHGHCHHKALVGNKTTLKVLHALPGAEVIEIDSGCCGMAGSFGYEKEHYEFSLAIGETRLFPHLRGCDAEAAVVASGISCRSQIKHGTGRHAQHLAQVVASYL